LVLNAFYTRHGESQLDGLAATLTATRPLDSQGFCSVRKPLHLSSWRLTRITAAPAQRRVLANSALRLLLHQ